MTIMTLPDFDYEAMKADGVINEFEAVLDFMDDGTDQKRMLWANKRYWEFVEKYDRNN